MLTTDSDDKLQKTVQLPVFKLIGLLMIIAALLLISGCKSTPPTSSGIGSESLPANQQLQPYLKVDNPELGDKVAISQVLSRVNQGVLEVNLELSSQHTKSQHLQYQFNWFDSQDFVVEPGKSNWQTVVLHGHQSISLRAVAPNANATRFNIYIREIPAKAYQY